MKDLFKKETNIALFSGLRVKLSTGEEGKVEGGFGQSGKVVDDNQTRIDLLRR